MFSCLNIIRIIVLEEREKRKRMGAKREERELVVSSVQSGASSLVKLSFEEKQKHSDFPFHPTDLWIIPIFSPLSSLFPFSAVVFCSQMRPSAQFASVGV